MSENSKAGRMPSAKYNAQLEKDKKAFLEACNSLDDPISVLQVILSCMCYFLLERPMKASDICIQMYKEFQDSGALSISNDVKSPIDLLSVVENSLSNCQTMGLVEKRADKYFLTEKGFAIGKHTRSFRKIY